MSVEPVNPPDLGPTPGYANGMLGCSGGRVLFVAGQIGVSPGETGPPETRLPAQFDEALRKIARVIQAAGGEPKDVGRMTAYVTDIDLYRRCRKAIGPVWRAHFGAHYPAMALVEVRALLDEGALVEIEATAVIGER
jgi:enamine deaminase RidA (YjgF/YER057c/UK114 family)